LRDLRNKDARKSVGDVAATKPIKAALDDHDVATVCGQRHVAVVDEIPEPVNEVVGKLAGAPLNDFLG
jgi:hypothetical protein